MEIWRDTPGYKGCYQASSLGRIKSLSRKLRFVSKGGREFFRISNEKILKQTPIPNGYLAVSLNKKGIRQVLKTHTIVAMAFLGHKRCGHKLVVDHKDDNILNNCKYNLQLITQRKNSTKKLRGKSKYSGVTWRKNRSFWIANIFFNGKKIYLGSFKTEIEASNAYQNKLKEISCV